MPIELIAKIVPKNDGFTGMVDANEVIFDEEAVALTLFDNNSSALSFSSAGKADIFKIITTVNPFSSTKNVKNRPNRLVGFTSWIYENHFLVKNGLKHPPKIEKIAKKWYSKYDCLARF